MRATSRLVAEPSGRVRRGGVSYVQRMGFWKWPFCSGFQLSTGSLAEEEVSGQSLLSQRA
jgi:hypothetical protein